MKIKTLLVVMAHAGGQEVFDRHYPYWKKLGYPMAVFCPADSVVRTDEIVWAWGHKSHHDAMANARFREMLKMARRTKYQQFVFLEYDALVWPVHKAWPAVDRLCGHYGVSGNRFTDIRTDREFAGTIFLHPPLVMNIRTLNELTDVLIQRDEREEKGFWDRWLGLACEKGNIPTLDLQAKKLGFSRNTIESGFDMSELEKAVANGAIFFHGVKSEKALWAIVRPPEVNTTNRGAVNSEALAWA